MKKVQDVPSEMARVARKIARWRDERTSHEPMPEHLWKQAVALAADYGVGPTARGIKVDFGGLRNQCERRLQGRLSAPGCPSEDEAVRFVELAAAPMAETTMATETSVELSRPDGAAMTVRLPAGAALDLGGLVTSFLGQDR